jgi:TetR/AcrR family transcriptional regulator, cholesterol catabolism regulator
VPRGGRRQQQKQDKLERIRTAAWDLFTTKGYAATTTKQVAARAGVATGTLFLYASDKRDLLFMVFHERLSNAVERGFASLPRGAPLLDQLMHLFGGFFHNYEAHPDVARDFVRALPGADGPNARAVNGMTLGFLYQLAGLVGEAQAQGEVSRAVEPLQAASNFFALYFGALLSWLSDFASLEAALDPLLKRSLALQIRGLLPRSGDAAKS